MALPLNDGSEHPIQTNQVEEWKRLYPAVNVLQELRNMRGWLLANPRNRKTKAGVLKFVNRWLAVEQDKAPRRGSPSPAGPTADEILRQKREQPPDGERQVTPEQGRPLQGRLEV
ncbi:MAG TPA: hypothetical protein VNK82_07200 [Terriglobales bacterium]|nr:hypothetical protein [Terriglobales bacterium]